MRTFLCAIDESVWDSVENGYIKPMIAKSEWEKAALTLANAISEAINAILYGVSTDWCKTASALYRSFIVK